MRGVTRPSSTTPFSQGSLDRACCVLCCSPGADVGGSFVQQEGWFASKHGRSFSFPAVMGGAWRASPGTRTSTQGAGTGPTRASSSAPGTTPTGSRNPAHTGTRHGGPATIRLANPVPGQKPLQAPAASVLRRPAHRDRRVGRAQRRDAAAGLRPVRGRPGRRVDRPIGRHPPDTRRPARRHTGRSPRNAAVRERRTAITTMTRRADDDRFDRAFDRAGRVFPGAYRARIPADGLR